MTAVYLSLFAQIFLSSVQANRPYVEVRCSDDVIDLYVFVTSNFAGHIYATPNQTVVSGDPDCEAVREDPETFVLSINNTALCTKHYVSCRSSTVKKSFCLTSCLGECCMLRMFSKPSELLPEFRIQVDALDEGVVSAELHQRLNIIALYPRGFGTKVVNCQLTGIDAADGETLILVDSFGCATNHTRMEPFINDKVNGMAESSMMTMQLNHSRLMMLQCAGEPIGDQEELVPWTCAERQSLEILAPSCAYSLSGLVLSVEEHGSSAPDQSRAGLWCLCVWNTANWASIVLSLLFVALLVANLLACLLLSTNLRIACKRRYQSTTEPFVTDTWSSRGLAEKNPDDFGSWKRDGNSSPPDRDDSVAYYSRVDVMRRMPPGSSCQDSRRHAIYSVAQLIPSMRRVRMNTHPADDSADDSSENTYEVPYGAVTDRKASG